VKTTRLHLLRLLLVAALGGAAVLGALPGAAAGHPFHPAADSPDTVGDGPGAGLRLANVGTVGYPTYLTSPRGDGARQFVVEQNGVVRLRKNGRWLSRPFLDVRDLVNFDQGERGLLSMAFALDYSRSRLFYIYYTRPNGNVRVDELRRSLSNPDAATRTGRRKVIEIPHGTYANHNGGQLQFGAGGKLYIATGDGGGGGDPLGSGQNTSSLLGKILRVDPRRHSPTRAYAIPPTNPFVGRPGRDEIWHYGLRNPWRFSIDPANGNMAIGDVGQDAYEEVDYVAQTRGGGANLGWNCFEGLHTFSGCRPPGYVPPALEYSHAGGGSCSVTGGYVVRDPSAATMRGRYLYGDYCTGAIHAALLRAGQRTPDRENRYLGLVVPRLTSFGLDAQGHLYMLSRSSGGRPGAVYRLLGSSP
jgi:glucose/arabinose dehydrogenase